jgi:TonB family protein
MVAGELASGQQVALELRLPNVAVPVRARALVRYQGRLHHGFEFVGLSVEQREMIRYWAYRLVPPPTQLALQYPDKELEAQPVAMPTLQPAVKIRVQRHWLGLIPAAALLLAVSGAGWWQWQNSWKELEKGKTVPKEAPMRVSPETMEMRIVSRVEPVYPEEARKAGKQGLAVLDAVIAKDGTVETLRPVAGEDVLLKSAADAVRWWRFEPYKAAGTPVEVETTIAVEFRLN